MRQVLLVLVLLGSMVAVPSTSAYYGIHFAGSSSACTVEGLVEIYTGLSSAPQCPLASHFAFIVDDGCEGDQCVVDLWFEARAFEFDASGPQMVLFADMGLRDALLAEPLPLCSTSGAPQRILCEFEDRVSFALAEGDCRDLLFRTRAHFDGSPLSAVAVSVVNACREGDEVDFYAPDGATWYSSTRWECDAPSPILFENCGAAVYGAVAPRGCDADGCALAVYTHAWGRGWLSLPKILVADVTTSEGSTHLCAEATQRKESSCTGLVTIDVPVAAGACAPVSVRAQAVNVVSATTATAERALELCRDLDGKPRVET